MESVTHLVTYLCQCTFCIVSISTVRFLQWTNRCHEGRIFASLVNAIISWMPAKHISRKNKFMLYEEMTAFDIGKDRWNLLSENNGRSWVWPRECIGSFCLLPYSINSHRQQRIEADVSQFIPIPYCFPVSASGDRTDHFFRLRTDFFKVS